jgi:hypothetical protein
MGTFMFVVTPPAKTHEIPRLEPVLGPLRLG